MPYNNITISDYRSNYFEVDNDHLLLDVRTPEEYASAHLPNAVNLPLDEIEERIHEVSRNQPIIVVCASGGRSAMVAEYLDSIGYGNVQNLLGGTMTWQIGMNPIERG